MATDQGDFVRATNPLGRFAARLRAGRPGEVEYSPWRPQAWAIVFIGAGLLGTAGGWAATLFWDRGPLASYEYHLWAGWEKETFPSNVFALLGIGPAPERIEGEEALRRYFALTSQIKTANEANPPDVLAAEALLNERAAYENDVERYVEGLLGEAITSSGLQRGLPLFRDVRLTWPPVNFELTSPPRLLVRSPRDRILRDGDTLLRNDLTLADIERIEERADDADTVSVVIAIGGLAAYPAIVSGERQYDDWLTTTAHEWVHHYLAFYPLGQKWGSGGDAEALNETTANLAGVMIADIVRKAHPLALPPEEDGRGPARECPPEKRIDFNAEMRKLRMDVDTLLAAGKVAEAEQLMEERRLYLGEHCVSIRKLNQAYFAFHGTYADTPASSKPVIGEKIAKVRDFSGSVGAFLAVMRQVESAGDLDAALERLEALSREP